MFLSTTGRIVRVDLPEGADAIVPPSRRSKHDAIRSAVDTTSRSEIGAITSRGRMVRFSPVDLPVVPPQSVQLGAGVRVGDYLALSDRNEKVLALMTLDEQRPIALGTTSGIVKRVAPGEWPARPDVELIALKPGDAVVGAATAADGDELVFIADDAQLLRFSAGSVRPQGRSAGGMAGVKLSAGATAVHFGVVPADTDAVVVTVAHNSTTLDGTDPGSGKVSDFTEFPAKGRATGGVRAQRFLRGEDRIGLAWVGVPPARALGADGSLRTLPERGAKRDASGTTLDAPIGSVGAPIA